MTRGRFATIGTVQQPITDDERQALQLRCDETYDMFKAHVARGRGLDADAVEAIAQGQVSGQSAFLPNTSDANPLSGVI